MSLEATKRAWAARGLTAAERLVLLDLADRASAAGNAWPEVDEIMDRTGLGKTAVYSALRILRAASLINPDWQPGRRDVPCFVPQITKPIAEYSPTGIRNTDTGIRNPSGEPEIPPRGKISSPGGMPIRNESPIESTSESPKGCSGVSSEQPKILPLDFWQRFIEKAGPSWGLPEKLAKRAAGQGLVVPMPEQSYLLQGASEALQSGVSAEEIMRLADFIAAGGLSWRGAAWQHVSRNFLAELSKAMAWDPMSDPRAKQPPSRVASAAPAMPQRVYVETTAKRQADAIERGELPEVDPAIVAAELRKMQEATS